MIYKASLEILLARDGHDYGRNVSTTLLQGDKRQFDPVVT